MNYPYWKLTRYSFSEYIENMDNRTNRKLLAFTFKDAMKSSRVRNMWKKTRKPHIYLRHKKWYYASDPFWTFEDSTPWEEINKFVDILNR